MFDFEENYYSTSSTQSIENKYYSKRFVGILLPEACFVKASLLFYNNDNIKLTYWVEV